MPQNPLPIFSQSNQTSQGNSLGSRRAHLRELQAKCERMWLIDPEKFNPHRNCIERERLERTWRFITHHLDIVNKQTADIGCGSGVFSRLLRDGGARVEAVDIAENALKKFRQENSDHIHLRQDAMPETMLPDLFFDLVLCLEIVAELPKEDHRLFFAEAARLLKQDGYLVCSSAIDIDTEGGVEKLIELALTEFDIVDVLESYHALSIKLKRFFEAPSLFIRCWKNKEQKAKELSLQRGFNKGWLWLNTTPLFIWPWFLLEPLTRPVLQWIKNSSRLMHILERITRFTSDRNGISHILFLAKKRPLQKTSPKDIPIQKPGRKEVWE